LLRGERDEKQTSNCIDSNRWHVRSSRADRAAITHKGLENYLIGGYKMELVASYIKNQDERKQKNKTKNSLGHDFEIFFNGQSMGKGKTLDGNMKWGRSILEREQPLRHDLLRFAREYTVSFEPPAEPHDSIVDIATRRYAEQLERRIFEGLSIPMEFLEPAPSSITFENGSNIRGVRASSIWMDDLEADDDN
jgi:hypothetical protein